MADSCDDGPRRIAVIVNPTKFDDLDAVREEIVALCEAEGWAEPLWLETTAEDPGVGQAAAALEQGVDVVCPLGGDGTVRSVATSLVGTGRPLGLLPGGTGNLLARNLGLPVYGLEPALRVVLTGVDRKIDVGLVRLFPDSPSPDALKGDAGADDPREDDEEVFLVMTGVGVDAEVMANTNEKVKGVLGWPAYLLAGLTRIFRRGFRVRLQVDGGSPQEQHGQSVIIGNCGTLQGDVHLMPDARLDDGHLDAVIMSPGGPFGWLALAVNLVSRRRRGHPRLFRDTGRRFMIVCRNPVEAQIDGDPKGAQYGLNARVLAGGLVVRVPTSA